MVIIINGYVALSDLNTGFLYIVGVNLVACVGWGMIDGLIYAGSSSIQRNRTRNKLLALRSNADLQTSIENTKRSLDDTFLAHFDEKGREAIAREIVAHVPDASLSSSQLMTREEAIGWLSIIGIYMLTGFLLALPFLVMQHKLLAWLTSNLFGTAWLFWYGVQLGKFAGRNRWLLGFVMGLTGITFLVISYVVWT
jgi:VIT1/CCC1 family predicted Fe2+/Mn2+ transporter